MLGALPSGWVLYYQVKYQVVVVNNRLGNSPETVSGPIDVVIRNASVVDGTGAEPFRADVVVAGDRIVAVEEGSPARGDREIDAGGLAVSPGFIDVHTHADLLAFLPDDLTPLRSAALAQGVTTLIVGNCGFSVFPTFDEALLGDVERHLGSLFGSGARVFEDLESYRSELEAAGLESNVAALVGQGTLRAAVVGFENRPPTKSELDHMCSLAGVAFSQGALGLSTGLLYPPGSYAGTDEIVAIARVAGRAGRLYVTHMRNEMGRVKAALDEAVRISENASVPLQVSHLKSAGRENHGQLPHLLDALRDAADRGLDVGADAYPYEKGSTVLHALLPPWATEGGVGATITRLASNETRQRLRNDFESPPADWQNFIEGGSWDDVRVASSPGRQDLEGQTIAEIASAHDRGEIDVVADLLISERCSVTITVEMASAGDVTDCLTSSQVMVGSDGIPIPGKPHPRWAGSFARVLSREGRERFGLTLAEAVRKMSSYPAQRFGLADRGVVRVGAIADLVVFDEERIRDQATYSEPLLPPTGVEHVIVNGQHVVDSGRLTGRRAGQVLSGPNARRSTRKERR